ncbi:MAG TPA: alpha/beta hydrolase [Candidatus Binataceae bacterium]|nr:alpha/beta hydrolase [Candidatus Binataceae bacterium]
MTSTDKFIAIRGLRLHYLEFGEAAAPVVVCLHGLTNNAHDFDPLAHQLAPRHRVIALDVRGRGDSQWGPAQDYNIPTYVEDLAALLDALSIRRVSLVGNSMGGRLAMLYAANHPERLDRLVLNDIAPSLDAAVTARINRNVADTPADFENLDAVVRYYRDNPSMTGLAGYRGEILAEAARWSVKPTPSGRLTWKIDPALRGTAPGKTPIRQLDLWPQFEQLTIPVLIVRGGDSEVLPLATAQRMCSVAKNARLVEVPGIGHLPSLVEPEVLAALREFLPS